MSVYAASQKVINITTIINTGYILQNYKNPSQNPSAPTGVDHKSQYMVATYGTDITGTGTADLTIKAQPGDFINWFGVSESNNFNNEIIIYGAPFFSGDHVFTTPNFISTDNSIMIPPTGYPQSPATLQTVKAWYLNANVNAYGTGSYMMQFGLYTPNDDGTMKLYGYFQWDPTVQVNKPS
jgi:hypothetical protein